jgi:hypothetical protein
MEAGDPVIVGRKGKKSPVPVVLILFSEIVFSLYILLTN